jgi:hypothetical protein
MKPLIKLLIAFCICLLGDSTWADSSQELSLSDLTRIADRIDVARCEEMTGHWQGKNIVTDNKLLVLQNIKGAPHGQYFTLTTLGGTAAHPKLKTPVKMLVPGGAQLNLNEEFLLFSKQMPDGQYQLVAFSQGLFIVELDANTGERTIPVGYKLLTNKDDTQANFLNAAPPLLRPQGAEIGVRNIKLEEMVARIQKLL